jgi:hypothetical protein
MEIEQHLQINLVFCLSKRLLYLGNSSTGNFIFSVNIFVTYKSDEDPDPPGSALVWLPGSGSVSGSAFR